MFQSNTFLYKEASNAVKIILSCTIKCVFFSTNKILTVTILFESSHVLKINRPDTTLPVTQHCPYFRPGNISQTQTRPPVAERIL